MAVSLFAMPLFRVFRFSMHVRVVTLAEILDPMKKWEIRLMVWRGDFHLVIPRSSHFGYGNFGYWWWYYRLRSVPHLGTHHFSNLQMRGTLHQWISKLCYHIALQSEGPEDSSLSFLSLVLTSSPSDHSEYISRYVLSGAMATDDAESNLREEGTKDEISEYSVDETGVLWWHPVSRFSGRDDIYPADLSSWQQRILLGFRAIKMQ